MTPDGAKQFDAFISYSHCDGAAARRVQGFLERYRLPTAIEAGRRRLVVFRDATDIRTGGLSGELNAALDASRALIVCCSPAAFSSQWVAQEIDRFLEHDGARPVIPILLEGDATSSIPGRLEPFNHRFADLRSASLAGWLKPRARDELIRVVATVTGAELRRLISWDKRRQRRVILGWVTALSIVVFAVSLVPIESTRKLDQLVVIGADQTIEYCDVVGDRLVLATRSIIKKQNAETTNEVQYVKLYSDASNPTDKGKYLDTTSYQARTRLVHGPRLRSAQQIIERMDRARVHDAARQRAEERYGLAADDKPEVRGTWAAEPRPGLRVLLFAVKPSPLEGSDGPAAGSAVVAVGEDGGPLRFMTVDGLYPPSISDKPASARGTRLMEGLPIVASGKEVFIGMSIRHDGGLGGLWRWNGMSTTWELERIPRSIYSVIVDPRKPGRVLASTAPARWESGASKGQVATQFFERPDERSDWREIQLLPVDSTAEVQLCGFLSDGTLYLRNQQALFALGTQRLYQRWF